MALKNLLPFAKRIFFGAIPHLFSSFVPFFSIPSGNSCQMNLTDFLAALFRFTVVRLW
jgi:hypothetical protein